MKKKKQTKQNGSESYNNNPFKPLKGFAVSAPEENHPSSVIPDSEPAVEKERNFSEEMDFLGVTPLSGKDSVERDRPAEVPMESKSSSEELTDEELFLGSLGQLNVCFNDQIPEPTKIAAPRRLKQLKLGKLVPDASLDLHGLQRHQVAEKITHFIEKATYHGWQTLLIVTGRGLNSPDGEPVLREETERFLGNDKKFSIVEWGRAPRQFGGDGALVVFLKRKVSEND